METNNNKNQSDGKQVEGLCTKYPSEPHKLLLLEDVQFLASTWSATSDYDSISMRRIHLIKD